MTKELWTAKEQLDYFEKDVAWHKNWIKQMNTLAEKWWDKPDLYTGFKESAEFSEQWIADVRKKILKIAMGERWIF
jgi:hypothetical protein